MGQEHAFQKKYEEEVHQHELTRRLLMNTLDFMEQMRKQLHDQQRELEGLRQVARELIIKAQQLSEHIEDERKKTSSLKQKFSERVPVQIREDMGLEC